MKIVIAPDSFKETMSSLKVANTIKMAFKNVFHDAEILTIPLADGGEGTCEILVENTGGSIQNIKTLNPIGLDIESQYGTLGQKDIVVIEMSSSCGLDLLNEDEKNPLNTISYGFGQAINEAIKDGAKKIILGLGGSATNDAGVGMLSALGVEFYDKKKQVINATINNLDEIYSFNTNIIDEKFKDITIEVACDVKNPLFGVHGATYTFGKQKGASEETLNTMEEKIISFSNLCNNIFKQDYSIVEGAGAAGGVGFALVSFLNASLYSGTDIIFKYIDFENKIKDADLIITGEGRLDDQSIFGKTPIGVAKVAKKYNIDVLAICGCLDEGYEKNYEHGLDYIFGTTPISTDFDTIKKNAEKNLYNTSTNIAKVLRKTL